MADRMRGLLGRDGLDPGHGLLLMECGSIHTFGMRFPIDVIFMGKDGTVLKVFRDLGPLRAALGGFRASMALEVQSGWLDSGAIKEGDRLLFRGDPTPTAAVELQGEPRRVMISRESLF